MCMDLSTKRNNSRTGPASQASATPREVQSIHSASARECQAMRSARPIADLARSPTCKEREHSAAKGGTRDERPRRAAEVRTCAGIETEWSRRITARFTRAIRRSGRAPQVDENAAAPIFRRARIGQRHTHKIVAGGKGNAQRCGVHGQGCRVRPAGGERDGPNAQEEICRSGFVLSLAGTGSGEVDSRGCSRRSSWGSKVRHRQLAWRPVRIAISHAAVGTVCQMT
jgi:hypothetical protein